MRPTLVKNVVIVPRNGYANRLQAWASAALLADALGSPLKVLWEEEPVATTPAEALFSAEFTSKAFLTNHELASLVGIDHVDAPRYLTHVAEQDLIVLAGHDRGEQVFMGDVERLIAELKRPTNLLIIAGGHFHLPDCHNAHAGRGAFYRGLDWSRQLDHLVKGALRDHPSFGALHVRQTDRSREAPSDSAMRRGLSRLATLVPERSLLISADTPSARTKWAVEARDLGFQPWSVEGVQFDRTSSDNGFYAMLEWRLMASATGVAHPAASTFSTEAVVASGRSATSVALQAGILTRMMRGVGASAESVVTYRSQRRRSP